MKSIIYKFNSILCGLSYPTPTNLLYLFGYMLLSFIWLCFFMMPTTLYFFNIDFIVYIYIQNILFFLFCIILFFLHYPVNRIELQSTIIKTYLSILIMYLYFCFSYIIFIFNEDTLYYILFLGSIYSIMFYFRLTDKSVYLCLLVILMCARMHISNYSIYSVGCLVSFCIYIYFFLIQIKMISIVRTIIFRY